MSLYPKAQGNPKLAATVVKLLDAAIGGQEGVAETSISTQVSLPKWQIGLTVFVKHLGQKGEIASLGNDSAIVDVGMRQYRVPLNGLKRYPSQGVAEGLENYKGIQLSLEIQKDDEFVDDDDTDNQTIFVQATASGRELGQVVFAIDYDDKGMILVPQDLEVDERFRGQGIAATMYDYVKSKGYRIHRSYDQTPAGAGFWDKHKPGKDIWEQGMAEGAPIVVMPRADRLKKAEPPKQRYMGDIVPPTKPPSTEKRGVKGRPGQRPMPTYESKVSESSDYLDEK
jgi:GNAT superfamily N-acetyltransferase